MNIINTEREQIINENNTAQTEFLNFIKKLPFKEVPEISVKIPLYGDLDLSFLREQGYTQVTNIYLAKGKITNIRNIPDGITRLEIDDNLLVELPELPSSMIRFSISNNHLSSVDLIKTPNIKYFNGSFNNLTEVLNIPNTIEELYLHNNKLKSIDLKEAINLKILHCSNNPLLVIKNLPDGISDFQCENRPLMEITDDSSESKSLVKELKNKISEIEDNSTESTESKIDYIEGLREYFKIKSIYDNAYLKKKRSVYNSAPTSKIGRKRVKDIIMPCIGCKRRVGTIFSKKDNKYMAICGDARNPCNFKISIFNGVHYNLQDSLYLFKDSCEQDKSNIIMQKMDTLFSYISDDKSVEVFKKYLEEFNEDSETYNGLLEKYNDTYFNSHKNSQLREKNTKLHESINEFKKLISEYKENGNTETLKYAMDLNVKDILQYEKQIRMLKYEIMEMEEDKKNELYILSQRIANISKELHNVSEDPRVITFSNF